MFRDGGYKSGCFNLSLRNISDVATVFSISQISVWPYLTVFLKPRFVDTCKISASCCMIGYWFDNCGKIGITDKRIWCRRLDSPCSAHVCGSWILWVCLPVICIIHISKRCYSVIPVMIRMYIGINIYQTEHKTQDVVWHLTPWGLN